MSPKLCALMIVINSSPAINLTAALGSLELLANLYGTVIVPHAVFQELEAGAAKVTGRNPQLAILPVGCIDVSGVAGGAINGDLPPDRRLSRFPNQF